jgi:hypothetical protein
VNFHDGRVIGLGLGLGFRKFHYKSVKYKIPPYFKDQYIPIISRLRADLSFAPLLRLSVKKTT